MSLHDQMARDAQEILGSDHANQPATYHFHNGDPDRSISVIVSHEPIGDFGDGGGVDSATIQEATVFVRNSATGGITTFVPGDEMTVAVRYGMPPVRCRVAEEVSSSALGFVLRVVA